MYVEYNKIDQSKTSFQFIIFLINDVPPNECVCGFHGGE